MVADSTAAPTRVATTAVLVPALNCASTIGAVVSGARQRLTEVVVVDDGSTDGTGRLAAAAGAAVITHPQRLGKGAALITGMQACAARGMTRVITMDGDGQHLPATLPTLLEVADAHAGALIIGARRLGGLEMRPISRFGNRFANRWVEIACGYRLPDTQSGLRVYPLRETLALGCRARHYAFETEVLIRAVRAGIAIHSVPVEVYYPPITERLSFFRPFVDTVRIIAVVVGLIVRVW